MISRDDAGLLSAGLFLLISILIFVNAFWFYKVHSKDVVKKIYGRSIELGFLYSAIFLYLPWGHYCLSSKRAKRAGLKEAFSNLSVFARRHLIFQFFGTFAAVFFMILANILMA